jgi:hypothetical protein
VEHKIWVVGVSRLLQETDQVDGKKEKKKKKGDIVKKTNCKILNGKTVLGNRSKSPCWSLAFSEVQEQNEARETRKAH